MSNQMVLVDSSANYKLNEAAVIVVALGWVLALGSTVLAAIILCGWRGSKQVIFDWLRFRVTFTCR